MPLYIEFNKNIHTQVDLGKHTNYASYILQILFVLFLIYYEQILSDIKMKMNKTIGIMSLA